MGPIFQAPRYTLITGKLAHLRKLHTELIHNTPYIKFSAVIGKSFTAKKKNK